MERCSGPSGYDAMEMVGRRRELNTKPPEVFKSRVCALRMTKRQFSGGGATARLVLQNRHSPRRHHGT
jgi:hypothetical protein